MNIAIIAAAGALNYSLVDKKINEIIEETQNYAICILCGFIKGKESDEETLGEKWAKANGAPIRWVHAKTDTALMDAMILKADYAIFVLDGNPLINQAFMRYKMAGKHGAVIKTNI